MINWKERSSDNELLDEVGHKIPAVDLHRNLQELNTINTLLGGHAITIQGFKSCYEAMDKSKTVAVLEIGCGGGDNLFAIQQYAQKHGIKVQLFGLDAKDECIAFAKTKYKDITFIGSYYQDYIPEVKPDIIFNSLFCHHFDTSANQLLLQWMTSNSKIGFFINDLQRHPIAFYSIKWLTHFFSKSYLVKHDAPLSVWRAYTKKEWLAMFESSSIACKIKWKWAFRFLITFVKNNEK